MPTELAPQRTGQAPKGFKSIDIPNVGTVDFPSSMSEADMAREAQRLYDGATASEQPESDPHEARVSALRADPAEQALQPQEFNEPPSDDGATIGGVATAVVAGTLGGAAQGFGAGLHQALHPSPANPKSGGGHLRGRWLEEQADNNDPYWRDNLGQKLVPFDNKLEQMERDGLGPVGANVQWIASTDSDGSETYYNVPSRIVDQYIADNKMFKARKVSTEEALAALAPDPDIERSPADMLKDMARPRNVLGDGDLGDLFQYKGKPYATVDQLGNTAHYGTDEFWDVDSSRRMGTKEYMEVFHQRVSTREAGDPRPKIWTEAVRRANKEHSTLSAKTGLAGGLDEYADVMLEGAREAKGGTVPLLNMPTHEVFTGVGSIVPPVVAGLVTRSPQVALGLGATIGSAQKYGTTLKEAQEFYAQAGLADHEIDRLSDEVATKNAQITFAVTLGTGHALKLIPGVGKYIGQGVEGFHRGAMGKSLGRIATEGGETLKKVALRRAAFVAGSGFGEGIEEGLDEVISMSVNVRYHEPDLTWDEAVDRAWNSFLLGAVLGGGVTSLSEGGAFLEEVGARREQAIMDEVARLQGAGAPTTANAVAEVAATAPAAGATTADAATTTTDGDIDIAAGAFVQGRSVVMEGDAIAYEDTEGATVQGVVDNVTEDGDVVVYNDESRAKKTISQDKIRNHRAKRDATETTTAAATKPATPAAPAAPAAPATPTKLSAEAQKKLDQWNSELDAIPASNTRQRRNKLAVIKGKVNSLGKADREAAAEFIRQQEGDLVAKPFKTRAGTKARVILDEAAAKGEVTVEGAANKTAARKLAESGAVTVEENADGSVTVKPVMVTKAEAEAINKGKQRGRQRNDNKEGALAAEIDTKIRKQLSDDQVVPEGGKRVSTTDLQVGQTITVAGQTLEVTEVDNTSIGQGEVTLKLTAGDNPMMVGSEFTVNPADSADIAVDAATDTEAKPEASGTTTVDGVEMEFIPPSAKGTIIAEKLAAIVNKVAKQMGWKKGEVRIVFKKGMKNPAAALLDGGGFRTIEISEDTILQLEEVYGGTPEFDAIMEAIVGEEVIHNTDGLAIYAAWKQAQDSGYKGTFQQFYNEKHLAVFDEMTEAERAGVDKTYGGERGKLGFDNMTEAEKISFAQEFIRMVVQKKLGKELTEQVTARIRTSNSALGQLLNWLSDFYASLNKGHGLTADSALGKHMENLTSLMGKAMQDAQVAEGGSLSAQEQQVLGYIKKRYGPNQRTGTDAEPSINARSIAMNFSREAGTVDELILEKQQAQKILNSLVKKGLLEVSLGTTTKTGSRSVKLYSPAQVAGGGVTQTAIDNAARIKAEAEARRAGRADGGIAASAELTAEAMESSEAGIDESNIPFAAELQLDEGITLEDLLNSVGNLISKGTYTFERVRQIGEGMVEKVPYAVDPSTMEGRNAKPAKTIKHFYELGEKLEEIDADGVAFPRNVGTLESALERGSIVQEEVGGTLATRWADDRVAELRRGLTATKAREMHGVDLTEADNFSYLVDLYEQKAEQVFNAAAEAHAKDTGQESHLLWADVHANNFHINEALGKRLKAMASDKSLMGEVADRDVSSEPTLTDAEYASLTEGGGEISVFDFDFQSVDTETGAVTVKPFAAQFEFDLGEINKVAQEAQQERQAQVDAGISGEVVYSDVFVETKINKGDIELSDAELLTMYSTAQELLGLEGVREIAQERYRQSVSSMTLTNVLADEAAGYVYSRLRRAAHRAKNNPDADPVNINWIRKKAASLVTDYIRWASKASSNRELRVPSEAEGGVSAGRRRQAFKRTETSDEAIEAQEARAEMEAAQVKFAYLDETLDDGSGMSVSEVISENLFTESMPRSVRKQAINDLLYKSIKEVQAKFANTSPDMEGIINVIMDAAFTDHTATRPQKVYEGFYFNEAGELAQREPQALNELLEENGLSTTWRSPRVKALRAEFYDELRRALKRNDQAVFRIHLEGVPLELRSLARKHLLLKIRRADKVESALSQPQGTRGRFGPNELLGRPVVAPEALRDMGSKLDAMDDLSDWDMVAGAVAEAMESISPESPELGSPEQQAQEATQQAAEPVTLEATQRELVQMLPLLKRLGIKFPSLQVARGKEISVSETGEIVGIDPVKGDDLSVLPNAARIKIHEDQQGLPGEAGDGVRATQAAKELLEAKDREYQDQLGLGPSEDGIITMPEKGFWSVLGNIFNPNQWGALPLLKELGLGKMTDRVMMMFQTEAEVRGKLYAGYAEWLNSHSKDDQKVAHEQFEEYIRMREQRAVNDAETEANRDAANLWLETNGSVATKNLVAWAKDVSRQTGKMNTDLQIHVEDTNGSWRLFKNLGENNFPRTFSPRMWEILSKPTDKKNKAAFAHLVKQIVDAAAAAGKPTNEHDVTKQLSGGEGGWGTNGPSDYFANLEKARGIKLPDTLTDGTGGEIHVYRSDVESFLGYIDQYSGRVAQIKAFGQSRGGHAMDAWEYAIEKAPDKDVKKKLQLVKDRLYRQQSEPEGALKWAQRWGMPLATVAYLSSFKTGLRNTFSGMFFNMEMFGVGATSVAAAKAFGRSVVQLGRHHINGDNQHQADYILDAIRNGTLQANWILANELGQETKADEGKWERRMRKGVNMGLIIQRSTENFNRGVTSMLAMDYVKTMQKAYASDPNLDKASTRRLFSQAARIGFNGEALDAVLADDPKAVSDFIRAAVWEKQFSYNITQHPLWMDNPLGRVYFQFHKWGYQRVRDLTRNTIAPVFITQEPIIVNGVEKVQYRRDAIVTALKNIGMMVPNGWMYAYVLRGLLDDKERKEPDAKMIMSAEDSSKLSMALSRLLSDIIYSGGAGIFGDYMAYNIAGHFDRSARHKDFTPVPASWSLLQDLLAPFGAGFQRGLTAWLDDSAGGVDEVLEGTWEDLGRTANRIPMIRQLDVIAEYRALRWMGLNERRNQLHDAKKDAWFAKNLARRYAKEAGIQTFNPFSKVEYYKHVKSVHYNNLNDALVMGDRAGAEAVIAEVMAEAGDDKKKRALFMKALKSSVAGRHPYSSKGGVDSETDRKDFVKWAKRNAPHTLNRIEKVAERYEGTAKKLRLIR